MRAPLTHCTRPGIKLAHPQGPEPLQSDFFGGGVGVNLHYMKVAKLGVKLQLQLPGYTTAIAMEDLSHIWTYTTLVAMPDPEPTEQDQGSNLHPHRYWSDS